jgi:hypothetical protein
VGGSAAHAVIRAGFDIAHEHDAANNHRVDGEAVHPSMMSVKRASAISTLLRTILLLH